MARAALSLSSAAITKRPGRTLSLRVAPDGRLRLNIPYGTSQRRVKRFVENRRGWIEERWQELDNLYDFTPSTRLAPGLTVKVEPSKVLAVENSENILLIRKPDDATNWEAYTAARTHIKERLNVLAESSLPGKTSGLASRHGLAYSNLNIKFMRSRWGSCTLKGRISLNSQLLRLPESLVEYVVIHELAHLKVAGHSKKFHELMESMLPNAKQMRRRLNEYRLLH